MVALICAVLAPLVTGLSGQPESVPSAETGGTAQVIDKGQALFLWRMTATLRLEPSVASIVFDVLERHERAMRTNARRQRRVLERLRAASRDRASDTTLLDLVDRSVSLRRKGREVREARWRELRPLLSTVQQAQFLLMRRHKIPSL
jgi:hypothetical protein